MIWRSSYKYVVKVLYSFQPLTKFQKQVCFGRPIVSTCWSPTELSSSCLDSILSPLVQLFPTYIWGASYWLPLHLHSAHHSHIDLPNASFSIPLSIATMAYLS